MFSKEDMIIGQPVTPHVARPPQDGQPIRLIMVGSPYQRGSQLLAAALLALRSLARPVELVYAGAYYGSLPAELRAATRYLGDFRQDELYRRMLAEAHVGVLTGPDELDCYGKYSFPSRAVDYLMAGLPVVGCIAEGSATEQILRPLVPQCVALVRTPAEFVEGLAHFGRSALQWCRASESARRYAVEHMSMPSLQERLMRILKDAAAGGARASALPRTRCVSGRLPLRTAEDR